MTVERIPIESRDAWLELRRQDVTASDVAAVCGVDPRKTPLQVYAEKLGLIPQQIDNQIMRRGRWLEAAFIEALADKQSQWETRRAKIYLRDPAIRIGATPDIVAIDPEREGIGIIQCKVVSRPVFRSQWLDEGEGPITAPLSYQLQTLTESMLANVDWAVIAALIVSGSRISPTRMTSGSWRSAWRSASPNDFVSLPISRCFTTLREF